MLPLILNFTVFYILITRGNVMELLKLRAMSTGLCNLSNKCGGSNQNLKSGNADKNFVANKAQNPLLN